MKKIRLLGAFERVDNATPEQVRNQEVRLPGFQELSVHMVFDVKMDGKFTRKARLIADGHLTETLPKYDTYASVVSRDSVRLAFLYAALNDLDVLSCDITNAYLNADCAEKLWIEAGPEFGSEKGSVMKIKKALYGLKSACNSWHATLSDTITSMNFTPSRADPNVYQRMAITDKGERYREWILVYVDDLIAISDKPKDVMDRIGKVYD